MGLYNAQKLIEKFNGQISLTRKKALPNESSFNLR
jgi:hypothetical protein